MNLDDNEIGDDGAASLADALVSNSTSDLLAGGKHLTGKF